MSFTRTGEEVGKLSWSNEYWNVFSRYGLLVSVNDSSIAEIVHLNTNSLATCKRKSTRIALDSIYRLNKPISSSWAPVRLFFDRGLFQVYHSLRRTSLHKCLLWGPAVRATRLLHWRLQVSSRNDAGRQKKLLPELQTGRSQFNL